MSVYYIEYQSPEAAHAGRARPERLEDIVGDAMCVAELLNAPGERLEDHALPVERDPEAHDGEGEGEGGDDNGHGESQVESRKS